MEDSFKVRVDKVFGKLGNTESSLSRGPSLWSLTDDEIKRQEWNRNKEEEEEDDDDDNDDESVPSDYLPKKREIDVRTHQESDLQELSDLEEDDKIDGETKNRGWNDVDDEAWDVQSLIGRDCTLDYEDEEDEYDRVAVCREDTGDLLYMRDVKVAEYGFERHNTYGELPNTFQDIVKDPRANHMAAKLRLKEDAEAAGDTNSLQYAYNPVSPDIETEDNNQVELDSYNPKPILKKRGSNPDSRSGKRVRFEFSTNCSTEKHEEQIEPCSRDDDGAPQEASNLPDYLRNPSKYTRYTFDSSEDMDEQSNQKAYMDFFHQLRKGNSESSSQDEACADITKPIVFTPRKKTEDDPMMKRRNEPDGDGATKKKGLSIGAAEEEQESEVTAMEEDEPDIVNDKGGSSSSQKPGRQYRSRTSAYEDDNLTT